MSLVDKVWKLNASFMGIVCLIYGASFGLKANMVNEAHEALAEQTVSNLTIGFDEMYCGENVYCSFDHLASLNKLHNMSKNFAEHYGCTFTGHWYATLDGESTSNMEVGYDGFITCRTPFVEFN